MMKLLLFTILFGFFGSSALAQSSLDLLINEDTSLLESNVVKMQGVSGRLNEINVDVRIAKFSDITEFKTFLVKMVKASQASGANHHFSFVTKFADSGEEYYTFKANQVFEFRPSTGESKNTPIKTWLSRVDHWLQTRNLYSTSFKDFYITFQRVAWGASAGAITALLSPAPLEVAVGGGIGLALLSGSFVVSPNFYEKVLQREISSPKSFLSKKIMGVTSVENKIKYDLLEITFSLFYVWLAISNTGGYSSDSSLAVLAGVAFTAFLVSNAQLIWEAARAYIKRVEVFKMMEKFQQANDVQNMKRVIEELARSGNRLNQYMLYGSFLAIVAMSFNAVGAATGSYFLSFSKWVVLGGLAYWGFHSLKGVNKEMMSKYPYLMKLIPKNKDVKEQIDKGFAENAQNYSDPEERERANVESFGKNYFKYIQGSPQRLELTSAFFETFAKNIYANDLRAIRCNGSAK